MMEIEPVHDGIHCGDCPYLEAYKHPHFNHSAFCWKQGRNLSWYDYWLADCAGNEPEYSFVKVGYKQSESKPTALEQAVDAVLERQQKILDFKPGAGSGEIGEAQLALHESIDRLREVHNG